MARQGLMDDSGYDFFDAGDCANYESCREEAFNDGYEKGRNDAIDEFVKAFKDNMLKSTAHTWTCYVEEIAEQMKEQNNA